jgi:hypothetical protein
MVAITGQVAITGGSISVTPSYFPVPTFVTTATGSGNNLITVNWAPRDGGTWGICGYQITNYPSTTSTTVNANTTSAVVVVPNTTTYFRFIVTPYNYVGFGSTATTSTIAAGFLGAAVNSNLYNLPSSATLSASPVVISSSTQNIIVTISSVTNTAPAIPTYSTNITITPGGTTATVLNANGGLGSCVYNSTGTATFTGLTVGTQYIFSSQAYNAIGYGTAANLTTSTYNLPTTPNISAASASASSINVTVGSVQNDWSLPTTGVIVTASPGGQQKTLYSSNSNTNVVPSSNSSGVLLFTGLAGSTAYTFTAQAFNNVGFDTNTTSAGATTNTAAGSQTFTYGAPGAFTFVVPSGITSVSVVAVGGGGKGAGRYTPGIAGTQSSFNYPAGAPASSVAAGGGGAYTISPVAPYGGPGAAPPGGTVISGTGGAGGAGNSHNPANPNRAGSGGGGAGGYSGAGGQAGSRVTGSGIGGSGGGGGGGSAKTDAGPGTGGGGGGGGVGLLGLGSNGAGGTANLGGTTPLGTPGGGGGSGGCSGGNGSFPGSGLCGGNGGNYGGGGGGASAALSCVCPPYNQTGGAGGALAYRNNITVTPGASIPVVVGKGGGSLGPTNGSAGGNGAVRVIWPGNTRSFPSTCAGAP